MNFHSSVPRNFSRFGSGGVSLTAPTGRTLSLDEIAARTPSVFADDKHSSRSDRYTFISTRSVLEGLVREGFQPVSVKQGGSRDDVKRGFTKHLIRFRQQGTVLRAVGDCLPEVCLLNSHDGTSAYKLFMGWFRLICLNGMIACDPSRPSSSITIPHKGNVVDRVIEGAFRVISDVEHSAGQIERFQRTMLTAPEQEAFATSAATLRFDDAAPVAPRRLLDARRPEDRGNDLWKTLNRVQENAVRGGLDFSRVSSTTGRIVHAHTRPVNSVDGDVKLNRALWVLAGEMAKLKAAA